MNEIILPKAVLWDLDGTLIDQTTSIIECYTEVISSLGYTRPDPNQIRRSLGEPMISTMQLFVEAEHLEDSCKIFRKRFPEMMLEDLIVLPGAEKLVKWFADRDIPQAILTNKHGETARMISNHLGFSKNISICIGNEDTAWNKPQPELTNYVLKLLKCSVDAVIVIGDSPTDIKTAKLAGIVCHCVSTGAHSIEELHYAGAVTAHQSLEQLSAIFESISSSN
ncbi:MAG: HAD family hydrolase [Puniceicoccaceae bacterium]|nr:HAD family hydrolase [Puniceicoccaceae bacterium]